MNGTQRNDRAWPARLLTGPNIYRGFAGKDYRSCRDGLEGETRRILTSRVIQFETPPRSTAGRFMDKEDLDQLSKEYWHVPQGERLQNTYALRCAPHVIGVLADALFWMRPQIEIELNSSNDNPALIDGSVNQESRHAWRSIFTAMAISLSPWTA